MLKTVDLKFSNIEKSFRDNLLTIYEMGTPFCFCAFPTTSAWDGIFFESVWTSGFEFYEYSDDFTDAGFSGKIKLEETPW
jgi:hypothetical protein